MGLVSRTSDGEAGAPIRDPGERRFAILVLGPGSSLAGRSRVRDTYGNDVLNRDDRMKR
jgi:hypothetical protein